MNTKPKQERQNGVITSSSKKLGGQGKNQKTRMTGAMVLRMVVNTLLNVFSIPMQGKFKPRDLFRIITVACAEKSSIEAVCKHLKSIPSARDVRYHLTKIKLGVIERTMNPLLQMFVGKFITGKSCYFAVDIHLKPYHGEPFESEEEVRKSKAKRGTTSFHAVATLYFLWRNRRFTVAMKYVRKSDSMVDVLRYLLDQLVPFQCTIKCLLMDKGFTDSVEVINFLKKRKIPFVGALPIKGKTGGTRGLIDTYKKSFQMLYTMRSGKEEATFKLYVVKKYHKRSYKKPGPRYFAYAVWGFSISIKDIFEFYRGRFGIESSYRIMDSCRARTSSRNPAVRLLFIVIAFTLVNTWTYLKWEYFRTQKRGPSEVNEDIFRFKRMMDMVIDAVKTIYGTIREVFTNKPIDYHVIKYGLTRMESGTM